MPALFQSDSEHWFDEHTLKSLTSWRISNENICRAELPVSKPISLSHTLPVLPPWWLGHKTVSGSNSKLETQSIWATPQVIYVKVKMAGNIAIDPSLVCLPCTFFFLHPMQKWHGEYLGTEDRWSWRRIGCGILRRCLLRQSWNRQWLAPC